MPSILKKYLIPTFFLIIILTSFLSCKTSKNQNYITYPCDLNNHLNDTITISGYYFSCMHEYTGFDLLKKDNCSDNYTLDLNFNNVDSEELTEKLNQMQGCTPKIKMKLKGILKKEAGNEYGHLGSNDAEFEILDIIYLGEVIFSKKED